LNEVIIVNLNESKKTHNDINYKSTDHPCN